MAVDGVLVPAADDNLHSGDQNTDDLGSCRTPQLMLQGKLVCTLLKPQLQRPCSQSVVIDGKLTAMNAGQDSTLLGGVAFFLRRSVHALLHHMCQQDRYKVHPSCKASWPLLSDMVTMQSQGRTCRVTVMYSLSSYPDGPLAGSLLWNTMLTVALVIPALPCLYTSS